MLKNIVESEHMEKTEYELEFLYPGENSGFGFDCDEHGNLLPDTNPAALENYHFCLAHPEKFEVFNHRRKHITRWREPAHGTCECGEEVYLVNEYMGACSCQNCGRWYNLFGQELNDPTTWADGDDW